MVLVKQKNILKKNYPNLYEKQKNEIDKIERRYQFDYMMYDAADNIEKTLSVLKNNDKYRNNLNKISPVLEIFLNKDANFKNFGEIIKNNKFYKLDKRIIYAFL